MLFQMANSYICKLEKDENGDSILILPDSLLEKLGWTVDTTVEFINNNNGTYTIKKVEENVTFGRA